MSSPHGEVGIGEISAGEVGTAHDSRRQGAGEPIGDAPDLFGEVGDPPSGSLLLARRAARAGHDWPVRKRVPRGCRARFGSRRRRGG